MRFIILICLLMVSASVSSAEIFCDGRLGVPDTSIKKSFAEFGVGEDDCVIAKVEGAISKGDAQKIEDFLVSHPGVVYLDLNLVGGELNESLIIGNIVREWSLFTYASRSNTCSSSCVLIWLGGAFRYAGDDHLKVHRFYVLDEEFRQMSGLEIDRFYREVTLQLREYLSRMGVEADQDELIRSIMMTPPEDLKVVNESTRPRLFGPPTSRDQWVRANGCDAHGYDAHGYVESEACKVNLVLRDRQRAGLLPSQGDSASED